LGSFKYIAQLLQPVKNAKEGISYVKDSSKAHAFIANRHSLFYNMIENGQNYFYLPPKTDESSFSLQLMGIAMQKEFKYKEQFNNL
jgi:hypothetical protein